MQWQIGDKVVHPTHGAGVIRSTCALNLEREPHQYYVIEIPALKMQVYVAMEQVETARLRRVISKSELTQLAKILQHKPEPLPAAPIERQILVEASLHDTQPERLAQVVRDLGAFLKNQHAPREQDRHLWDRAVALLAMEWALAADCSFETARVRVQRLTQSAAPKRKKI